MRGSGFMRPHSTVDVGTVIDLENIEAWPQDMIDFLKAHYDLLLGWECQSGDNVIVSARAFDRTIERLCAIIDNYFLTGWHCTRLTDAEIGIINDCGMRLPNLQLLRQRIDAIEAQGLIHAGTANRLRSENQANDDN